MADPWAASIREADSALEDAKQALLKAKEAFEKAAKDGAPEAAQPSLAEYAEECGAFSKELTEAREVVGEELEAWQK
jgi:hypothetical protein